MVQHTDLPSELRNLFGDSSIPPETRQVINGFWTELTNYERQQLIDKLQKETDPLKRILIALMEAMGNKLKFADVKKVVGEHLKTALGITDFSITFAKQETDIWKVNVSYPENIGGIIFTQNALFSLNNRTGEVMEFQKGRYWTM